MNMICPDNFQKVINSSLVHSLIYYPNITKIRP